MQWQVNFVSYFIDIFAGIALARMGFSEMAITGCVSEPLFSQAFGVGISMLINTMTEGYKISGAIEYSAKEHPAAYLPLMGEAVCVVGLMVFFIYNFFKKFRMTKLPSIIELAIYGASFVAMFILYALVIK